MLIRFKCENKGFSKTGKTHNIPSYTLMYCVAVLTFINLYCVHHPPLWTDNDTIYEKTDRIMNSELRTENWNPRIVYRINFPSTFRALFMNNNKSVCTSYFLNDCECGCGFHSKIIFDIHFVNYLFNLPYNTIKSNLIMTDTQCNFNFCTIFPFEVLFEEDILKMEWKENIQTLVLQSILDETYLIKLKNGYFYVSFLFWHI